MSDMSREERVVLADTDRLVGGICWVLACAFVMLGASMLLAGRWDAAGLVVVGVLLGATANASWASADRWLSVEHVEGGR